MTIFDHALSIIKKLNSAGHIAYFAGGWVRDFLMKHPSDDIDIATSASPEEVQKLFPNHIPVGLSFGILVIPLGGHNFEVATFRIDVDYQDGRRPSSIKRASPEEDAKRRDFTINGLFYDPLKDEILDYVGGKKDIELGLIRAIGNPHERFKEDRLRMMRAARYSSRFSFPIELQTFNAILEHASELIGCVAIERIWQEFQKMSRFAHFDRGLILLHELTLLGMIFPSLKELSLQEIKKRVANLERFPKNTPCILELLELFPGIFLDKFFALCDFLKLSNEDRKIGEFLLHARALLQMPEQWQKKLEKQEWAHFYANADAQRSLEIFALTLPNEKEFLLQHENRVHTLQKAIERIREKNPVVRSADLIQLGIKPGVIMGKLLKEAERIAINENLEESSAVLAQLKETPLWAEAQES
jgi:poly(A) polymerase